MADALIDESGRQSITARLNTDGLTIVRVEVNSSTHALEMSDGNTGSNNGGTNAAIDSNGRQTWFATSSADGVSLVALYSDSSGKLLIQST